MRRPDWYDDEMRQVGVDFERPAQVAPLLLGRADQPSTRYVELLARPA